MKPKQQGINDSQEQPRYSHTRVQQLSEVVSQHLPRFRRRAMRYLGSMADAEDAVHDAILSAYTHLDQFNGRAKLSTWLTSIVINSALMKLRWRRGHLHLPLDQPDEEKEQFSLAERLPDTQPNAEEIYRARELSGLLRGLMPQLSPRSRRAFQLRVVDGLSLQETAQILGLPVATVKVRVTRARMKLRSLMQGSLRGKAPRHGGTSATEKELHVEIVAEGNRIP